MTAEIDKLSGKRCIVKRQRATANTHFIKVVYFAQQKKKLQYLI